MPNTTMKALFVVLLSVVGLANAEMDSYCTSTGSYQVPYPSDCSKFISCDDSTGTVLTCPGTAWFDVNFLVCRPQDVAQCSNIPSNDVPNYVLEICSEMPNGQSLPAIACGHYYVCQGTKAYEMRCPAGQHYSRAYSACMNPLEAGCRALNTMCVGEYANYTFPALVCEDYYVCNVNLMPELQSCAAGLYWSPALQVCTSPAASGCINAVTVTPTPSGSTISTGSTNSTSETTTPIGETTTPGCGNVPVCNSTNSGSFYPHPDCKKFYMCHNSEAEVFECDCGNYFNPTCLYCVPNTDNVCVS